jgi:hypothetical protein
LITYNIVCVIILELLNVGVDQGLGIPAFNAEFLCACESGRGKENKFNQGDNAVVFNDFRDRLRLADLLSDHLRGIKKINLAICLE